MKQLCDLEWKEFFIESIAEIESGRDIYEAERVEGKTPYATATAQQNGIGYFVGNKNHSLESNCLTVNRNGSVGFSFYHPYDVLVSNDCRKLRLNNCSKYIGLFISQQITKQKDKYGYGYKMGTGRLKRQKILLPIDSFGNPDYPFMEAYMKDQEKKLINKYHQYIQDIQKSNDSAMPTTKKEYKEFYLRDLFYFQKGNQKNMAGLQKGTTPLVSAKNCDNGYKDFVSTERTEENLFSANCLTINNDGDGGAGISYYQPCEMALDSHVTALIPKIQMSRYILHFLSSSITKQREKFGHGYSINNSRLNAFKFMLPVNNEGNPDYVYMEQYMKALELKQLEKYSRYIQTRDIS